MLPVLFAGIGHELTLVNVLKGIIVIACVIGVMLIVLRVVGVTLPLWVWQIAGIVAVALVALVAIDVIIARW